ncbi:MAG TPA: hypothetical protein DEA08_14045 [Planctomycetes bacterium]|nr:hypothetical protein [Planctomycetota bacterium]
MLDLPDNLFADESVDALRALGPQLRRVIGARCLQTEGDFLRLQDRHEAFAERAAIREHLGREPRPLADLHALLELAASEPVRRREALTPPPQTLLPGLTPLTS